MKPFLACLLLSSTLVFAQEAIPAGTILAAQLNRSLDSGKARPGQKISARLMQDVPLASGKKIPAGAKILGQVVKVQSDANVATLTMRFDTLRYRHNSIAIRTNLRALASLMEVEDAQTPKTGPDRGTPWIWNTRQLVGGEVAYGDGGAVMHGSDRVGDALADGVLIPVVANPVARCRGEIAGNANPQALWVFSSDACGVFGLQNVRIVHAGRTDPTGNIVLASDAGDLRVQGGSGILLRVGVPAS
jgi:hypothetical protein